MPDNEVKAADPRTEDATTDVFELLQHGPVKTLGPICIMGVNGSGKSRFIRNLHQQLTLGGRRTVHVPAHREFAENWSGSGAFSMNVEPYGILQNGNMQDGGPADLPSMINHTIAHAQQLDMVKKTQFIRRVADWIESDEALPKPERPSYFLERLLDDLGTIIGKKIVAEPTHKVRGGQPGLLVEQDGVTYPVSSLSSGERQILLFAILGLQNVSEHVAILVDEPELHLNESRAIELWSALEAKLPAATFIYATHSVNFATRPEVKHLFIVEPGQKPTKAPADSSLPNKAIKDLVGARILIRRSDSIPVLCEDLGQSLVLKDILTSRIFEPITVNARETVIRAVLAQDEYSRVLADHPIKLGLIDRDFATEDETVALEKRGIFTLPYNEFESCLLHPNLVLEYLRISDDIITDAHYLDALVFAAEAAPPETLQKLKAKIETDHKPTIRHELSNGKLSATVDVPSNAVSEFLTRGDVLQKAISSRDTDLILQCFKGKLLYKHFRRRIRDEGVDLHEPYQLYRTMREIPKLKSALLEIPAIKTLAKKLAARSE